MFSLANWAAGYVGHPPPSPEKGLERELALWGDSLLQLLGPQESEGPLKRLRHPHLCPPPWGRVVTETLPLAWVETGRLWSEGVTSQSLRSSEVVRG